MYIVGKIVATHGIKGELKVKSETDFDRFKVGNVLYIYKDKQYLEITIRSHRPHKGLELITINDYNDINEVMGFVGCEVFTKHEEQLEEDEFYVEELIGLKVTSTTKDRIGEVVDVREVPQGYILEVKTNDKNVLIPFVSEFIIEVNEEEIIVNVIEGLI